MHPQRLRSAIFVCLFLAVTVAARPATAQQTTGSIIGRVVDQQGNAVPGVTVSVTNAPTGLTRSGMSDVEGIYRLTGLPVGVYDLVAALTGFAQVERGGIQVDVSRTTDLTLTLRVARVADTVTVTAVSPLIPTTSSSLGEVVSLSRIESLPLNGRQFANLAMLVPGVGLGFHADLTKATQFTPQISGGNGRNINYLVDGGDNNDDTVGGLLQLFPLEAVEQFNVMTQRFDAEFGRSNGGVLNVVTKSGTNTRRGSWFTLLRDDSLNARTFSEKLTNSAKQPYHRYQFGGSTGGPIVRDKVHYFAAYERTQQDTRQAVNTLGIFPADDGVYDTPTRENLFSGKLTATLTPTHYTSFRYGFDNNAQLNGPGLRVAPSAWTTSRNTFHSLNAGDNWVIGGARLNELVFQYSRFRNAIPASSDRPFLRFPNGVTAGANPVAPQTTEQDKWQFRDDFSWSTTRLGGLAHDFKVGVNWIHEPHLFISTTAGSSGQFTMGSNDLNGPVTLVTVVGGASAVNIPLDLYGLYVKDDWRATDRLTLNLGLRWDYVDGMPIDQSRNPNFVALQTAGRAGRFAGTPLASFGKDPKGDTDNIQPRAGFAFDLHGDGSDVLRGGWGIYTDFAYTNANALTPAIDAAGGSGFVFIAQNPAGIRKADGSLFLASDPLSSIAAQNSVNPNLPLLVGLVLSPTIEQPYTKQSTLGWAHQVDPRTAVTADYVHVTGHDLNLRLRANTLVNGRRLLADLPIQPNNSSFRVAINGGTSDYNALILSVRRRVTRGLDGTAWYTLSSASSTIGSAYDELDANLIQDARAPFAPIQDAPSTRTDARHRFTFTMIADAPWGLRVAPVFLYRSGLPIQTVEGIDFNADGNANDITAKAYRYAGINDAGVASFKEIGTCTTVNCSRRAPASQLNLRVSRAFGLGGRARVEAIAEVFNLFNALNPSLPLTTQRVTPAGAPLASFMQPTAYSGDFQQPEQRVGQLGFRLTF